MRSQRLIVTLALSLPAIAGLTACSSSSDSTSPKKQAVAAVDTVLANVDNLGVLELDTLINADTSLQYGWYSYGADQFAGYYYYANGGDTTRQAYRPVITYDLPTLLGQGVVDSARAYVWQCQAYGYNGSNLDPFSIGHVTMDHVNLGRVVESSPLTFWGDTLNANIGAISSDSTTGLKSMAVTSYVQADYSAKRPISQYRLNWVFTTAPTLTNYYSQYYVDLGSDCENTNGGPGPYIVIWSH